MTSTQLAGAGRWTAASSLSMSAMRARGASRARSQGGAGGADVLHGVVHGRHPTRARAWPRCRRLRRRRRRHRPLARQKPSVRRSARASSSRGARIQRLRWGRYKENEVNAALKAWHREDDQSSPNVGEYGTSATIRRPRRRRWRGTFRRRAEQRSGRRRRRGVVRGVPRHNDAADALRRVAGARQRAAAARAACRRRRRSTRTTTAASQRARAWCIRPAAPGPSSSCSPTGGRASNSIETRTHDASAARTRTSWSRRATRTAAPAAAPAAVPAAEPRKRPREAAAAPAPPPPRSAHPALEAVRELKRSGDADGEAGARAAARAGLRADAERGEEAVQRGDQVASYRVRVRADAPPSALVPPSLSCAPPPAARPPPSLAGRARPAGRRSSRELAEHSLLPLLHPSPPADHVSKRALSSDIATVGSGLLHGFFFRARPPPSCG